MASQEVSLRVTKTTPEIIDYLRRQIFGAVEPRQIVLFGSQARGDAQLGSDVDLLIVHGRAGSTGGDAVMGI